jgi:excisionase family DNA binding protein
MGASNRLLRVGDVAMRLGLKESTIRRQILERRICYVKVGRAVRIPVEAVEQLIKAGLRPAVKIDELSA